MSASEDKEQVYTDKIYIGESLEYNGITFIGTKKRED